MFDWFVNLWSKLFKVWDATPPDVKDVIKKQILKWLEDMLRQYYRSEQSKKGE